VEADSYMMMVNERSIEIRAARTHNSIEVEVGPEVLTGSTRLNQDSFKNSFNSCSTAQWIVSGKVYQKLNG